MNARQAANLAPASWAHVQAYEAQVRCRYRAAISDFENGVDRILREILEKIKA